MKIFGKNPVLERLRTNPSSVRKVFIQHGTSGLGDIRKKALQKGISVFMIPKTKMLKIGRNTNTQGVLIDVADFEYEAIDDLLDQALKKKRCPIFLDGLKDPQNLGAIIRSLSCLGKFSLVLPSHESVGVTEAVMRVASGGDNYVPIAQVANLKKALVKTKDKGFTLVGAVVHNGVSLAETKLPFPMSLVIGSEQKGIRDVIRNEIDLELTIPMSVSTLSFNVAHATSIMAYEIIRQKITK